MDKKVLVFGVSGFVGKYLSHEFHDNDYKVYGSDIRRTDSVPEFVDFRECDLLDAEGIKNIILDIQPTHVVNLAAISNVGLSWNIPQKTIDVNVNGTLNILEASRQCDVIPKILLIGSSEEYAISDKPMDENSELDANNPYGISKMMQEKFSQLYRSRYGMKIYHVRSFNHTGIGQTDTFVIPSFCKQIAEIEKSGRPGTMYVGNLLVERDLGNVKDFARAYRMVIESDKCESTYNIGTGCAVSLSDILNYIISLSSQHVTVVVDPNRFRPTDNRVICCNYNFIKTELGWEPQYSIYDTVKELYEYYLVN
ncbi:GDP-mannose 4,6-dehydratase [Clostridium omnivorum]|uniref:GDP-mannose 4,6-dehydratase n=2 Tax=Clostridium omnivorum TaxID=1604902 RepID=A0ABQ5N3D0_9CLOT|nr:GDP-mannose 4,6-dehydratase [Clostridium sp. E14]